MKLIVAAKAAQALSSPTTRRAVLGAGFVGLVGLLGTGSMLAQAVQAGITVPSLPGAPAAPGGAACAPGACVVSASEQEAAQQLVAAMDAGRLVFLYGPSDPYAMQIRGMADGSGSCRIQLPALQLIQIALNMFDSVGISDLNRACTGDLPGSSGYSAHWVGRAIDFYAFNGTPLTGGDSLSVSYVNAVAGVLPAGSQIGQIDARIANGTYFDIADVSQISDAHNHLHVDVGRSVTDGLRL
ncbi:hypothetical protein [Pseudoclavibacter sp. Z016]|uniref:hypothetical protein n=1 Tax=Pseudoclavibacter sp. Z016 TaxID=2080581 RepID=UPI000CE7B49F|nr:hypothetical protein [Pseudoclavibacter sp. Z016]PPF74938.1 hypothetical protein C5B99_12385 [Pseudoclavibacter sp. Z016]